MAFHVTICRRGGLRRTAAVLTRAEVRRVPIPPVMLAVCLLVTAVVLFRLVQELGKRCHILGGCPRYLPFAARKACFYLLQQPTVPVGIFERGKRIVGTTFRIAPVNARAFPGIVERAAREMEHLAHFHTADDQLSARGIDVVHGEGKTLD